MSKALRQEFDYYIANQKELVEKYRGRVIVIKGKQVVGVYRNEVEAVTESERKFELGTFLVQKCEPGEDNYTQTFHSRVSFA